MSKNSLKTITDDQVKTVAYRSLTQMIKSVPASLASIRINTFDVLKSRSNHYDYYGRGSLDIVTTADQQHYIMPIRLAFPSITISTVRTLAIMDLHHLISFSNQLQIQEQ